MLGRSPHHPGTTKSGASCFICFPFVPLQADLGLLHSKLVMCSDSPNPSKNSQTQPNVLQVRIFSIFFHEEIK